MSSLPTPEEPRVFKATDALLLTPDVDAVRRLSSRSVERALEDSFTVAQELTQVKKETGSGHAVMERLDAYHAPNFGLNDQESLLMHFGGERAQKGRGGVTVDTDGLGDYERSLVKTNHEEAERAIGNVSKVINYLDVLQMKIANPTLNEADVLKEKGFPPSKRDWDTIRANGLAELMKDPSVGILFPELRSLPADQVALLLERTLASDPKLLAKINKRMKDISTRSRDLSHVEIDPELQRLNSEKTRITTEQQEVLDHISSKFEEIGHTLTPDQKNDILRRVNLGDRPDMILRDIRNNVIIEANIGDRFADIVAYQQLVHQEIPELRAFLKANATVNRAGVYTPIAGADAGEVTRAVTELTNANAAKSGFEGLVRTDPDLSNQLQKFADLSNFLGISREGGTLTGPLFQEIQRLGNSRAELKRIDTAIAQKSAEAGKKEKASLHTRLAEEMELVDEIDTVLGQSIKDVINDKLKELDAAELVRLDEAAKTAKENGEEGLAAALHRVAQERQKHWISYDEGSRKKNVDKDEMTRDMRTLAYQGEDGVKRLILRDLVGTGHGAIAEAGTGPDQIEWRSVDLETGLTDQQKEIVEKVYATHGQQYKEKLMLDYFGSRNLGNKIGDFFGTGGMALKDHEWRLLEQNFSGMLEERMKTSPEAQQILKQLQEKGVTPNSKTKWYIFALLGLLGGVALAVVGAPVLGGGAALGSGIGAAVNRGRKYSV